MLHQHSEIKSESQYLSDQGKFLSNFQRKHLVRKLQSELRSEYRKRIEIMLLADHGHSQAQICQTLGCCHLTARYWIAIAQAGKAHQWNEQHIGRPKTVNEQYLNQLQELVSHSPREYGYPFQRWTGQWLRKHLLEEVGIDLSDRHIHRLLKEMGLSTRSLPQSKRETEEASGAKQLSIRIQDLSPLHPPI